MAVWTLILWLAIGAAVGLLARRFIGGTPPFGAVGDIILGIGGGIVGGYGIAILGATGTGGMVGSFITAFLFALLLVWSSSKLRR